MDNKPINPTVMLDLGRRVEALEQAVSELQGRHHESSIRDAYARYDSDPRVSGPDDYEAFRDAVKLLNHEEA